MEISRWKNKDDHLFKNEKLVGGRIESLHEYYCNEDNLGTWYRHFLNREKDCPNENLLGLELTLFLSSFDQTIFFFSS